MLRRVRAALPPLRLLATLVLLFSSCCLYGQDTPDNEDPQSPGYRLGPADNVKITVFKQEDLSGNYVLDGDGRFDFPLIGLVQAQGLTTQELAELLVSKLKPDYLVNPRVSIEVLNYRPYYLIGEVRSTGSFQYVQGITYLTAIAMAGGYSYRAKKGHVFVIRGDDPDQEEVKLDVNEKVQPGDIIRVAERYF